MRLGRGDEAALEGVGDERNVGMVAGTVDVEDEVVGEAGGVDQRGAVEAEDELGLEHAGDVLGVGGAQGRRGGGLDGGQADDDDGLGVVEGGRGVEAEVELLLVGEGDGGDVLVLGGVEAAGEADEVDDGADVGAVEATAGGLGVAGGVDEVAGGSVAEAVGDALAVAVVEQHLVAALGEAVVLLVDGLLEAVVVGLEGEGAGEQGGVVGEGLGVTGGDLAHVVDVALDAGLLEAGLVEILGGADEGAGAAFDGGAEGAEVAAGLGGEEEQDLLGLGGDGDEGALLADLGVPGLDAGEPAVGGRIGGAAEEGDDHEVVHRLGGGEVGMDPELVAGLQVGDLGDGQGEVAAGDADLELGTGEIEAGAVGPCLFRGRQQEGREEQKDEGEDGGFAGRNLSIGSSLDGENGGRGGCVAWVMREWFGGWGEAWCLPGVWGEAGSPGARCARSAFGMDARGCARVWVKPDLVEARQIQGSLHCATDDEAVRRFGRDDVCCFLWLMRWCLMRSGCVLYLERGGRGGARGGRRRRRRRGW